MQKYESECVGSGEHFRIIQNGIQSSCRFLTQNWSRGRVVQYVHFKVLSDRQRNGNDNLYRHPTNWLFSQRHQEILHFAIRRFFCLHFNMKINSHRSSNCIFENWNLFICWLQNYQSFFFSFRNAVPWMLSSLLSRSLSKRAVTVHFTIFTLCNRNRKWEGKIRSENRKLSR